MERRGNVPGRFAVSGHAWHDVAMLRPRLSCVARRAITVAAGCCLALLAALPAAAVSPERARTEGTNPSLGQRVVRYDRWVRAAQAPPGVLIIGSSRSVQLDPRLIRRLSGRTAFNAGISDGGTRDQRAMVEYANLRTPDRFPHLVVLLSIEAFQQKPRRTRVLDYQARMDRTRAPCDELPRCRGEWMRTANAIASDARRRQRGDDGWLYTQRADGLQTDSLLARWDREGVDMAALTRHRIGIRMRSYGPGRFDRLLPTAKEHFERTLAIANRRGDAPMIALTAMHPDCIRLCGPRGWNARRAEARRYLDELAQEYDFRLLDMSYPATWGGSGRDFYDEIHLRPRGAAKVVRRLHAVGAFTSSAVG